MIIYNVTIKVDIEIVEEWASWMVTIHIPNVMATGSFSSYKMLRLLDQDESDGVTFATQYTCADIHTFNDYVEKFAPLLRKETEEKYKNKIVAFRTLLEEIHSSSI